MDLVTCEEQDQFAQLPTVPYSLLGSYQVYTVFTTSHLERLVTKGPLNLVDELWLSDPFLEGDAKYL